MNAEKFDMFRNRLAKVLRHRARIAKKAGISCYRVYDHDLPEFPFCIEMYEENTYVAEYERRHGMTDEEHEEWADISLRIIQEVTGTGLDHVFLKLRRRKKGRSGQYRKTDDTRREFIVHENGLKFIVNLSDFLDTGLFLDHRLTREMVREESAGKKVMNLFSYTGSFSVYAAAGGASGVVTVDLSNNYLEWARRNMQVNGFVDPLKFSYVQADVTQFLSTVPPDSFDLVIMDPPTFSNSKKMEGYLDIQRDHGRLINECLRVLKAGAGLYFSTNFSKFELDTSGIGAATVKNITGATTPFDFAGKLERQCFYITK